MLGDTVNERAVRILLLVFLSAFLQIQGVSTKAILTWSSTPANDCFYLAEEELTFYKARETCVQYNMQLTSVDSQVCILLN